MFQNRQGLWIREVAHGHVASLYQTQINAWALGVRKLLQEIRCSLNAWNMIATPDYTVIIVIHPLEGPICFAPQNIFPIYGGWLDCESFARLRWQLYLYYESLHGRQMYGQAGHDIKHVLYFRVGGTSCCVPCNRRTILGAFCWLIINQ